MDKITRREFISLGSKVVAGAVLLSACGIPEKELILQSPADLSENLAGNDYPWYATTCPDAPGGDGIIARVVQGRVKKLAGNPDHPVNLGKQNTAYDPEIQILYHPDRIKAPLLRRSKDASHGEVNWDIALREASRALRNGAIVVTNPLRGLSGVVADKFVSQFGGRRLNFHVLEQHVLKNVIKRIFNTDILPDIDIANARSVASFGADWLSGWLSPTHYSVQYGKFRSGSDRGFLTHTEARFSLTAANADLWLPTRPGTEGDVALAMARVIVDERLASDSEINMFSSVMPAGILFGYAPRDVANRSGVPEERIVRAARRFATERPSVAFGGGSAAAHTNGSVAIASIYALNHLVSATSSTGGIIINPESILEDLKNTPYGNPITDIEEEIAQWRAGFVDTVIIRGANIVLGTPEFAKVKEALREVPNVIVFANVMDDTAKEADIVFPETTFLEEWGADIPHPLPGYTTVNFQQPVAGVERRMIDRGPRSFADVMLELMNGLDGSQTMQELARKTANTLFATGRGSVQALSEEMFLRGVLQRGGWWDTSTKTTSSARPINPFEGESITSLKTNATYSKTNPLDTGNEFHLLPFEVPALSNGRLTPAPWALQCPDPISSVAWVTWCEINSKDADQMGISEGDILLLRSDSGEIEVVAYPHPAAPPSVVSVPIGFGSNGGGRYSEGRGANVMKILSSKKDEETGSLAWAATKVKVIRSGRRIKMPKFEGNVEAFQREPGVPVLIVAPGQSAEEAEKENHHKYQEQFLGKDKPPDTENGEHTEE